MAISHLYLLVFPEKGLVKIGKANDILQRLDTLRRWWGDADYASSYYVAADERLVFRLERSLHCLLDEHAIESAEGDGKTEIFRLVALESALRHLDIYLSSKAPNSMRLFKGIEPPATVTRQALNRTERSLKRFATTGRRFFTSIDESTRRFEALHKLVAFLVRRQDRICYQWDVVDGDIAFRVKHPRFKARELAPSITDYFTFHVEDFTGSSSITINHSTVGVDDVTQFNIHLPQPDARRNTYLDYMLDQAGRWLSLLPRRSAAVTDDLPVLDFHDVWNDAWKDGGRE